MFSEKQQNPPRYATLKRLAPAITLGTLLLSRISAPYEEKASIPKDPPPAPPDIHETVRLPRVYSTNNWNVQIFKTNQLAYSDSLAEAQRSYISERRKRPPTHFYASLPVSSTRTITVLTNEGYISGFDMKRKATAWVVFRLFKVGEVGERTESGRRKSSFSRDPRLGNILPANPFAKTGYDHGHLAPNNGIGTRYGQNAQDETFLISNIAPQKPELNQKTMRFLEALQANEHANAFDEIWVKVGPVYDQNPTYLANGVEIPDAFFNIESDEDGDKIRVLPFLIGQNTKSTRDFAQFLTSVEEIERLTELDFESALPDIIEEALETNKPTVIWDAKVRKSSR